MALPLLVPFPDVQSLSQFTTKEWDGFLNAWINLVQSYLNISNLVFRNDALRLSSLVEFIVSFTVHMARRPKRTPDSLLLKQLRRNNYLLTHRIWTQIETPPQKIVDPLFIGDFCIIYSKIESLDVLIESLWARARLETDQEMVWNKNRLIKVLESSKGRSEGLEVYLLQTAAFLKSCTSYGSFLMTGSDFLDALTTAWERMSVEFRKRLIAILYRASLALLQGSKPNVSLLLDHMYSLKLNNGLKEGGKTGPSIIGSLVSTTPFLDIVSNGIPDSERGRAKKLLSSLEPLKKASGVLLNESAKIGRYMAHGAELSHRDPSRRRQPKLEKGKKAVPFDNSHMHRMSLVSQIQDLFPDLGAGFIIKLLEEYEDDPETVTAHLLDNSLPQHLKNLDQSLEFSAESVPQPAPEPFATFSGHPERRNIYNNDSFSNLTITSSSIHIGKRNTTISESSTPNKAAILAALATFDSDSDERDDTYDADDIGGTVDTSMPSLDEPSAPGAISTLNNDLLVQAWRATPDVFQRDAKTRQSKPREELRKRTDLSDEVIEGWGLMLSRDPRRLRRLEASVRTNVGPQMQLASTAWRAVEEGEADTEEANMPSVSRERGAHRGRGRGGRGKGGGDVAGSASDAGTRTARQKKIFTRGLERTIIEGTKEQRKLPGAVFLAR